jgi:hypothetical protein
MWCRPAPYGHLFVTSLTIILLQGNICSQISSEPSYTGLDHALQAALMHHASAARKAPIPAQGTQPPAVPQHLLKTPQLLLTTLRYRRREHLHPMGVLKDQFSLQQYYLPLLSPAAWWNGTKKLVIRYH